MDNLISFVSNFSLFDIIFLIFITYFTIQCFAKGFVLSLLSFLKWILALIITIKLSPIIESKISDYIDLNEYIFKIGLGVSIYFVFLFVIIIAGKSLGKLFSYTGLGSADKIFGFFFGIFKGYVFAVCIFSIVNWFYSYEKWDISLEGTLFFPSVKWGSKLLIDKFPSEKDYINEAKEKINDI